MWEEVRSRAGSCQVTEAADLDAMQVYLAVRELVQEHRLEAITIGCYPHLMGRVCLTASLLADEGVPFACEGDVNGAVGQLMLYLLTGQPTHHTDWLDPLDDGTVVKGIGVFHPGREARADHPGSGAPDEPGSMRYVPGWA